MGGTGGMAACAPPTVTLPAGADSVFGTMIQFNDNGGWCWYQDERAVVDTKANKLVIGDDGERRRPATATNEAVVYDIATNTGEAIHAAVVAVDDQRRRSQLARAPDPARRQVPREVVRPPRRLPQPLQHLRRHGLGRGEEDRLGAVGCPWAGAATNMVTYSNPWYIGSSIFSMVRSVGTDPAFLTSTNDGQTWSYYGRLTSSQQVGYVAGYFKYWGDNTGRIDFLGTEAHPRDNDNSLWHGYIQGGKVYNSVGTLDSLVQGQQRDHHQRQEHHHVHAGLQDRRRWSRA